MMHIQCFDYLGWPVELLKGRPVTNVIRRILHTRGIRISIGSAPPVISYTREMAHGGVAVRNRALEKGARHPGSPE